MKKQLLLNLFKNHSWLEIGLESLWAAIILEYTQQPFTYPKDLPSIGEISSPTSAEMQGYFPPFHLSSITSLFSLNITGCRTDFKIILKMTISKNPVIHDIVHISMSWSKNAIKRIVKTNIEMPKPICSAYILCRSNSAKTMQ